MRLINAVGETVAQAKSGADGLATLADVPEGLYLLRVRADACRSPPSAGGLPHRAHLRFAAALGRAPPTRSLPPPRR